MTTTTLRTTISPAADLRIGKPGVLASLGAAATTTALAASASAAGVSFADAHGESIPLPAFAQLTLVFSLIGVAIAAVMARKASRPRATFLRTTVTLTALSLVPDATFGFDATSAATLMALHLVAAAIVIPVLMRRLPR
jgi:hypothetical protein